MTEVCVYLQLSNWEPGDRAVSEHQRHYPNCRFVRGDRADNVPLAGAAATSAVTSGAPALTSVSNPSMQQSDERLLTFVNWPSRMPVRPEQLAKAGFYYVGTFSITETVNGTCFQCLNSTKITYIFRPGSLINFANKSKYSLL